MGEKNREMANVSLKGNNADKAREAIAGIEARQMNFSGTVRRLLVQFKNKGYRFDDDIEADVKAQRPIGL